MRFDFKPGGNLPRFGEIIAVSHMVNRTMILVKEQKSNRDTYCMQMWEGEDTEALRGWYDMPPSVAAEKFGAWAGEMAVAMAIIEHSLTEERPSDV